MKILAVDYGETRTGLAICDESELLATPLPQITEKSMNKVAAYIAEAAAKEGAARILLGLPMNMDGTEGARAAKPPPGWEGGRGLRPAGGPVGRAPHHHHRSGHSQRQRRVRPEAQGPAGFGERRRHSGRIPRLAQKPSGGLTAYSATGKEPRHA